MEVGTAHVIGVLAPHPLVELEICAWLEEAGYRPLAPPHSELSTRADNGSLLESCPSASAFVIDVPRPCVSRLESITTWARRIHQETAASVILLSDDLASEKLLSLVSYGVKGLVPYPNAQVELISCLNEVLKGGLWIPRRSLARYMERLSGSAPNPPRPVPESISQRERQVLDGLAQYLSNKEIAGLLNISERTVKFHVSNILRKFNVASRHELSHRVDGGSAGQTDL